jgi:dolichol-phosphate mannosyltransferase
VALDLSVVLPVLDEEMSLRVLLPALKDRLAEEGVSFELLCVDGGSKDGTAAVAAEHGARCWRQTRPGFGGAIAEGLSEAKGEWAMTMDADGSHSPDDFPRLWRERESAEVVIGSRFVPGGSSDMPAYRFWLSRLLNSITRLGLGLPARDASSGYRLYRRSSVSGLPIEARDFSVQQEVLGRVLAAGGRHLEVPFSYRPRIGGESKASLVKFASSYLKMFLLLRRLRRGA